MKQGQDITAEFPGILIIHQKIRGNTVDRHEHREHEVFVPLQGEIQIQAGELALKAGPGKMVYLPPGSEHSFQSASTSQGERLIFIVQDSTWKKCGGGSFPPLVVTLSQLCKELLFHLLLHPRTRATKSLTDTLIITVSEMLEGAGLQSAEVAHLQGRTTDPRIRNALQIIEKKFSLSLSIGDLAREAGLSTRNLNRLFLEELSMTPKQVITVHRIEAAKKLLRSQKKSVTDITFEVGYNSVSQFITTFRKLTGKLPSEFV